MGEFQNIIAMWSGSSGNIPPGWQLCDGTNGTPNLRNRFIIGSQGNLNIGDTGGSTSHSHNFTSDGHFHLNAGTGVIRVGAVRSEDTAISYDTALTDPESGRPPWYTLAIIMRMS